MASRLALRSFLLFTMVSTFGLPGLCESEPQQLQEGIKSSGSTKIFQVWPKSSDQEWTLTEGFPWTSCNHSDDNRTCPGFLDYLDYFCGERAANLTSAEVEKETVVLLLLPGVHKIKEPKSLTCRQKLVIEGGGALDETILETEEDSTEIRHGEAALELVDCNELRIKGITFRSRGAGRHRHYVGSYNSKRFEVRACVFQSLGPAQGALSISAGSMATYTLIIDCRFHIQAAQVFYPFDMSRSAVDISLTTTPKKNQDHSLAHSHLTVLRSSFVLHVWNLSCPDMRNVHRTWTM